MRISPARTAVTALLTGFLFLFLILPLVGLLLASVVGRQVPVLQWVWQLELLEAWRFLAQNFTLEYFREILVTPRYYRGFFNAAGLAPVCLVGVFASAWAGEGLFPAGRPLWRWLRGPFLPALFVAILVAVPSRHGQGPPGFRAQWLRCSA